MAKGQFTHLFDEGKQAEAYKLGRPTCVCSLLQESRALLMP